MGGARRRSSATGTCRSTPPRSTSFCSRTHTSTTAGTRSTASRPSPGHMLGSASVVLHLEIVGRRPAAAPPVQRRRRARRSRHHDPVRRLPGARYPGPADPGRRAPDPDLRGAVHARGERPPERRDGSGDGRGAASPGCRCRHAEPSSSSTEPRAGGARAAGPPPGSPEAPRPQDEAPAAGVSPALKRARLFAITEQASSTSVAQ